MLFLELPTPRSLGSTKPTMAVPVAPASVDSPRLKQGEALQQASRCPAASGCRGGGCGQGGHEWTVGRGEAWLALARLQINSSPAASQPRGGRENSFHTVFADFFFFTLLLLNRSRTDCPIVWISGEKSRAFGLVSLLVTFSPPLFSQGLDGDPRLSWAHPGTWDLQVMGKGLAPEGRGLRSTEAPLTREP